jgi:hypothetical protein
LGGEEGVRGVGSAYIIPIALSVMEWRKPSR